LPVAPGIADEPFSLPSAPHNFLQGSANRFPIATILKF